MTRSNNEFRRREKRRMVEKEELGVKEQGRTRGGMFAERNGNLIMSAKRNNASDKQKRPHTQILQPSASYKFFLKAFQAIQPHYPSSSSSIACPLP